MTRGEAQEAKVHFKGKEDDFVVMVESADAVKRWKEDKSVPLVEVVSSFDVFCTHKYEPIALPKCPTADDVTGKEPRASSTAPPTLCSRMSSEPRRRKRS